MSRTPKQRQALFGQLRTQMQVVLGPLRTMDTPLHVSLIQANSYSAAGKDSCDQPLKGSLGNDKEKFHRAEKDNNGERKVEEKMVREPAGSSNPVLSGSEAAGRKGPLISSLLGKSEGLGAEHGKCVPRGVQQRRVRKENENI